MTHGAAAKIRDGLGNTMISTSLDEAGSPGYQNLISPLPDVPGSSRSGLGRSVLVEK